MGKQYEKKITWAIKNFSTLQCESIRSDPFVVGGCKWVLELHPKGNKVDNFLYLFLEVDNYGALPSGWRRHTRYLLTIENQNSEKSFKPSTESQLWFQDNARWSKSMFPLNELHVKDSGFLVNGELKIVAHVEVLEVVGKLDVSEETSISETMYVHDFQLLPSQVKSVSRMFEKHSELASEFRPKNPNLRTAYMSFLLNMIQIMCQSTHELSKDDMSDAYIGLGFMTEAGFKLDWLGKKLNEISEKKEKEHVSETRLQEMEKELKDLKEKCSNMEAMVEKEKGEVSAAKVSRSFDDVV